MRKVFRILLPLLVIIAAVLIAYRLISSAPEPERNRPRKQIPVVEVLNLQPQSYQVQIPSRGSITPRTQTTLISEVEGRIIKTAPSFYAGSFFEAGETLLRIDPRDYENAVTIARADVTLNTVALKEEQARSQQALKDWSNLNMPGDPDPLLLRHPQLRNAEATLAAARARLRQAELDLQRTVVKAPYAGRILQTSADLGQFLSKGRELAQIYASDTVEIRLPLNDTQLGYLTLPEEYRHEQQHKPYFSKVDISFQRGAQSYHWQGQLVRTEGAVDSSSRQLYAIARIKDPFVRKGQRPQLKIGQFVNASIQGHLLEQVLVIPRAALRDNDTIHIVTKDNHLHRHKLDILWRAEKQVIATPSLQPGQRICLTKLPFATEGIEVQIAGQSQDRKGTGKPKP